LSPEVTSRVVWGIKQRQNFEKGGDRAPYVKRREQKKNPKKGGVRNSQPGEKIEKKEKKDFEMKSR